MSYMLLIVEPTEQRGSRTESEGRAVYDRMLGFAAELQSQGLLLGGRIAEFPRHDSPRPGT